MKKHFISFPKKRIELPSDYKKLYNIHHLNNRTGGTKISYISQKIEEWMHWKVASDIKNTNRVCSTLEIGAGTLNQIPFENNSCFYDIVEPFNELFASSKWLYKIRKIFKDINEIDEKNKYDRITSIATFEHILNLPDVVSKCAILLKGKGCLRVAIPNEGSFLWKFCWKITSGLEFWLKYKLDYSVMMKYEHINTAKEIEEVLKYFFKNVECSVFGINKTLSLYRFYACSEPNISLAREYIKNYR